MEGSESTVDGNSCLELDSGSVKTFSESALLRLGSTIVVRRRKQYS